MPDDHGSPLFPNSGRARRPELSAEMRQLFDSIADSAIKKVTAEIKAGTDKVDEKAKARRDLAVTFTHLAWSYTYRAVVMLAFRRALRLATGIELSKREAFNLLAAASILYLSASGRDVEKTEIWAKGRASSEKAVDSMLPLIPTVLSVVKAKRA